MEERTSCFKCCFQVQLDEGKDRSQYSTWLQCAGRSEDLFASLVLATVVWTDYFFHILEVVISFRADSLYFVNNWFISLRQLILSLFKAPGSSIVREAALACRPVLRLPGPGRPAQRFLCTIARF